MYSLETTCSLLVQRNLEHGCMLFRCLVCVTNYSQFALQNVNTAIECVYVCV